MAGSLAQTLRTRLLASVTVSTLVGGSRITAWKRVQDTPLPACTFEMSDDAPDYNTEGRSGLYRAVFELSCWAASYQQAHSLADACQFQIGATTWADGTTGIDVVGCFLTSRTDAFDEENAGEDATTWRVVCLFDVHYRYTP